MYLVLMQFLHSMLTKLAKGIKLIILALLLQYYQQRFLQLLYFFFFLFLIVNVFRPDLSKNFANNCIYTIRMQS